MTATLSKPSVELTQAVIGFAGDSGDGMQLVGTEFANTSANLGNDISTFPDFPAEIRAPAGTIAGVSGFQLQFSSDDIYTPGDRLNALVAMNPAALKLRLKDLEPGGILIVNKDSFAGPDLRKAGYPVNPLEDGSLGRLPRHRDRHDQGQPASRGRLRAVAARGRSLQELLRPRRRLLAVRA